eukprot:2125956-Amphidinium_carterae.3
MERTLKNTAPARAVVKKPWISDSTWALMYTINKWRRMTSAWRPSFGSLLQIDAILCSTPAAYVTLANARTRILVRASRRALRHDRRQWFENACAAVADGKGSEHLRKLHAAVRLLSRTTVPRGRILADENGYVVRGADDVQAL